MITLIYKSLYRSTESGNWRTDEQKERIVTEKEFDNMKSNCSIIDMTYSEKYNEFFYMNVDRLHATRIIVKEDK